MKLIITIIITFGVVLTGNAQTCLPDGILLTQQEIDNFATNYPGCTEIIGFVQINHNVTNLDGISHITSIGESQGGFLKIPFNQNLIDLSGLENLTNIGGKLDIFNCGNLLTLNGLNNLQRIGNGISILNNYELQDISALQAVTDFNGDIRISESHSLESLNGLNNITSTYDITIQHNSILTNLEGLNGLQTVENMINIEVNAQLQNLHGLNNLTSSNIFHVSDNFSLESLSGIENLTEVVVIYLSNNTILNNINGLQNIDAEEIENFIIQSNPMLSDCAIYSLCEFLDLNIGLASIVSNAAGCNSVMEVQTACTFFSCLSDGITFTTQSDIDNFLINYPNCTQIGGDVIIQNSTNITNLDGLANITFIGGSLIIDNNTSLVVLSDSDDSQPGFVINGLSNLTSITDDLIIKNNSNLSNLNGLSALSFVGGIIHIEGNNHLTSLTGINSVGASSFDDLIITNNSSLSLCEVESICSYLNVPSNSATISNNAQGCNSRPEVETACSNIGIEDYNTVSVILYPNPTAGKLYIEGVTEGKISIYDTTGKFVKGQPFTTEISLTDLNNGLYFILIEHEGGTTIKSILKK